MWVEDALGSHSENALEAQAAFKELKRVRQSEKDDDDPFQKKKPKDAAIGRDLDIDTDNEDISAEAMTHPPGKSIVLSKGGGKESMGRSIISVK